MNTETTPDARGACDYCGHADGHRIPGGTFACEPCFYTLDESPE